ncbi:BTAD domain-containing putative transcriptional regulator [Nocardioides lijunqiniae]|uniref:BTAD domain-containing putative transcriptional regulator n=1 Tax=Nocardioides lijunqiniae TaxID=2760832 RepID=UPI001878A4D0|nr:BTAD domain-containing putative transcriptional regulator [Nocardioides lijunqiniae]
MELPGAGSAALSAAVAAEDPEAVVAALAAYSAELLRTGDLALLRDAARVVSPDGGVLRGEVAWRLGYALHQSGRFDEALACYARADRDPAHTSLADLAQLYAAEASTLWARGDAAASRVSADRALECATGSGDDSALGSAWVSQALVSALEGDRHTNRHAYARALEAAARAGDVLTQVRVHNNLGSLENEEGRYAPALVHLDEAVALWQHAVPAAVRALTCINRAESLLGLGRVEEALAELEHARALTRDELSPLLGYAVLGSGDANAARGNATQAAVAFREAIGFAERTGDAQVLVPALAGLARATVGEDLEEAQGVLKRALDQPAALGQVSALLAAGWVALVSGQEDRGSEYARQASREAGRRHDARGLAEALELQSMLAPMPHRLDLVDEAATVWAGTGHAIGLATNQVLRARAMGDHVAEQSARRRLRALGVRDGATRIAGALQALGTTERAGVTIRALGSFAIHRSGEPVPASEWQSRKSRDALKILVGRRGRPISREALCEHLWPETLNTGSRLSVVLSTLRAVLDPEKRLASDHYLAADRQSVRLDVGAVEIDVVAFQDTARAALRAIRARGSGGAGPGGVEELERAAAMYTGHFLEDDPYADWSVEVRDELLALALDVRRELAAELAGRGEHQRAVPWLVGLVADDPYDEPAHQALVRSLHLTRRHGEARRCYRAYVTRMEEIDASPLDLADLLDGRSA